MKGKTYKDSNGRYLGREKPGCIESWEKMSKSKGNGIEPTTMSQKYGVDALRTSLLFSAPPDSDFNFEETILQSIKGYLNRVERLQPTIESQKELPISEKVKFLRLAIDYETKM